jgi:hypothetical protein
MLADHAHAARLVRLAERIAGDAGNLGHAEAAEQVVNVELLAERLGGALADPVDGADGMARSKLAARPGFQDRADRFDEVDLGRPLLDRRLPEGRGGEPGYDDRASAHGERPGNRVEQRVHMEERQHDHDAIALLQMHALHECLAGGDEAPLTVHHPFRMPGRSRGVDDHAGIVGRTHGGRLGGSRVRKQALQRRSPVVAAVEQDHPRCRAGAHGGLPDGDQRLRRRDDAADLGVGQHVTRLLRAEVRIDRHHDRAQARCRKQRQHVADMIARHHRHAVALADAAGVKHVRQPCGFGIELIPRQACAGRKQEWLAPARAPARRQYAVQRMIVRRIEIQNVERRLQHYESPYMMRPGVGSVALRITPCSASVMNSVLRSGPP